MGQSIPTQAELYQQRALEARRAGQFVDIDWMLPSLLIHLGPGREHRWTCKEALDQLEAFRVPAREIGCTLKDYILVKVQEQ